jgi:predicted benzoate:H+ symporter BenE
MGLTGLGLNLRYRRPVPTAWSAAGVLARAVQHWRAAR